MIQKAVALKNNASERERAYIDALAKRYSGEAKPNRTALDRAYREAMRELHNRYPNDLDAATLYTEAVMDFMPWNYWMRDMQPYPETVEVMRVLESVLASNPNHPGAIHLYIHTVELARPELAAMVKKRLKKAWNRADVKLASSRFMGEAHARVTISGSVGSGY